VRRRTAARSATYKPSLMTRDVRHRPIYLDYHATTPVDPRVAEVVWQFLAEDFGNAHSRDHVYGDIAEEAVEQARSQVSSLIGASASDVFFTSGATESLSIALGTVTHLKSNSHKCPRLGVTAAEHAAVLDTARALATERLIDLTILPVDRSGHVELDALGTACKSGLDAVCVIAASNEVGTITDLSAVARITHESSTLLISDATQAVGKIPVRVGYDTVDILACSGHKIYGPKGIGVIAVRPGVRLRPLIPGGIHERGVRGGTLNVPGIAGMGEAARLRALEMDDDEPAIATLRDDLQLRLQTSYEELEVNGNQASRLSGNLHVSFPGIPNQAIIARIRDRLAVSTGSACSSGLEAPSHVLRAMGLNDRTMEGALRFGVGKFVSPSQIATAAEIVLSAVADTLRVMGSSGVRTAVPTGTGS